MDDDLVFHIAQRTRELEARGLDPAAAHAEAMRHFGVDDNERGAGTDRRATHQGAGARRDRLADFRQDLHFGVRSAVRAPLFSLLAVVTLAMGIGVNAAVFGVVKSVLLDALPYADSDRLVRVYGTMLDGSDDARPLSPGTISDIVERQRSFERFAAFITSTPDAVYGDEYGPHVTTVTWVEPDLFRTLGVPVALGRGFSKDDVASDTSATVLLTHGAWQRLFTGDASVVGSEVRIDGLPRTVVGVLPADFVAPLGDPDFYFPFILDALLGDPISARRNHWLGFVGRLAPGVTHEAAQRELAAIAADLAREYPEDNASLGLAVVSLRDAMMGDTRTPLLVLLASAALVLLIACANLAGALLSRTISRRREFAVRVALGAGRGRLVRQFLTENLVLTLTGAAAGLFLAALGLGLVRRVASPSLPAYADLSLDAATLAVTAVLALFTGLAFSLAPAVSVGRSDPQGTLRDETRGASESRRSRRLRGVLVAGQVALCLTLLMGAGLLARSLWAMLSAPIGFDPDQVMTAAVRLPGSDYGSPEEVIQFQREYEERLSGLPGVQSVASASELPTTVGNRKGFSIEGAVTPPNDAQPFVLYASVSDGYFRTLGIPLREGRTFDAQDAAGGPPTVVISESMARQYWPGRSPLGTRIRMGPDPEAPPLEVVGIVGDVRNDPAQAEAEPMAYRSIRQDPASGLSFLVRTQGDPASLLRPMERELTALDPGLPLYRPITMTALLSERLQGRRLPLMLMGAFGVLALLLASIGVYAMFASLTAARVQEFGIRMALGSTPRAVAALVLRQGTLWIAFGMAGGAVGIVLIARMLRNMLFGIPPLDPVTLSVVFLTLLACAAVALLVPVRRATRVDPATALRGQ